jgi:hypothetical protein
MLLTDRAAFPVLLRVTVCAALGVPTVLLKVRLVGEALATGAAPVPVRVTICGLVDVELSVMLREAVRVPPAAGVKVTLMVQLALAATELPQVLVWAKSPESVPVTATVIGLRVAFPVLLRVTDCAALVVPRFWLLKVRLAGERVTTGPVLIPLRAITCVPVPAALSVIVRVPASVPTVPAGGVKVTLIAQLAPAARVEGLKGQLLVWEKLELVTILVIVRETLLLVLVTLAD